jgi:membrane protease YdiL (CAAX protease family)
MENHLDDRRVWIFLALAFGLAWAIDLLVFATGGLGGLTPGSWPWLLLVMSMAAPALAHILTRLATGEGWHHLFLRPQWKHGRLFWLIAWIGTPLIILIGVVLYFGLVPSAFDRTLAPAAAVLARSAAAGRGTGITPQMLLVLQALQAIIIGPLVGGLATLGEEFGWRAYLLPKMMRYGGRKAMLLIGLIWGIWHWPIILMGFEYGFHYPGGPWLGPLVMLWFTFVAGIYLAWLTLKAGSVWPAVIAHASINAIAAIGYLAVKPGYNPLLGPGPQGLAAAIPFSLLALWLLWRSPAIHSRQVAAPQLAANLPAQS